MPSSNWKRLVYQTVWALAAVIVLLGKAHPEHLPIKTYTTSDGLAQNAVNRIVRDSRGFLWFCTEDGLSRYDGYTFTNYGVEQGLPSGRIIDLLETREGKYWIATFNGLCRFNPKGRPWPAGRGPLPAAQNNNQPTAADGRQTTDDPMFVPFPPNDYPRTGSVNVLLEDQTGAVWCGAGSGLYRLEQMDRELTLRFVEIGLPREVENDMRVRALVEDRQGALWIGAGSGLYRRWPDGRSERYTTEFGLPSNEVRALLMDANGQLWVATREGVLQITLEPGAYQPRIIRVYTTKTGLPDSNARSLFQLSTGQLWIGLSQTLVEFVPQPSQDGAHFRYYASELGVRKLFVQTLAEDRDGNLWIGTDNGALKLARNGFATYTAADGLGESRVSSLFESRAGDLGVMTLFWSATPISCFEGNRFRAIRPQLSQPVVYFGWGWHQLTLQDQAGEWWLPTGQGLVRYPKVDHIGQLASTPPKAIYTTRDGLVSNDIFRLYEDSRGDIWIATFSEARCGITRWQRTTETFHNYGEADGLPPKTPVPHAFAEDRAGNLWIGFVDTDSLARFSDGRFTLFTSEHGVPEGKIYDLYLDHAGRLWIASTTGGLGRIDDPGAERPRLMTYTMAQGLSSNSINCITEDRYGRMYIGTARGLDRLDPDTGRVKPFTAADGLISGDVLISFRDRKGDLWFGGKGGLSHLSPQPDPPQSPLPVLITGLRIGGETQQISALGETEIAAVELGPNKNQIQIDFVALGFSPGEGLRYQYKLEGAGENWSPLAVQRTVNFANLAPGGYRFMVRAVNADGVMSETPASFSFTILQPIWQRWWFLMLGAVCAGLIAYRVYGYRVARLLELERIRTRIATDLHDDIGANLSLIAMASEVATQRSREDDQQMTEALSLISGTSRELVDSMGDIVWAVNPQRDHLVDLVKRMRRFASDVFSARHIAFHFESPIDDRDIRLGTETRREVLLIFKEAVNNIARHSECNKADIEFKSEGGWLVLKVRDNGKGFDTSQLFDGNGLVSMRRRAERLGGLLEVVSRHGEGMALTLKTPLR
jgi:ligand-binding sensor domain-containing protein/two-component sensor histidine kinase